LNIKDYSPGDLAIEYETLKTNYDDFNGKSEERIALVKEKEKQENAERKAQQKLIRKNQPSNKPLRTLQFRVQRLTDIGIKPMQVTNS